MLCDETHEIWVIATYAVSLCYVVKTLHYSNLSSHLHLLFHILHDVIVMQYINCGVEFYTQHDIPYHIE